MFAVRPQKIPVKNELGPSPLRKKKKVGATEKLKLGEKTKTNKSLTRKQ